MKLAWMIAAMAAAAPQVWAAVPPGPHTVPGSALSCVAVSPTGRPLTFTPGIGLTPRRLSARGNLLLTGCASADGTGAFLRSGWVTLKGTAQASCTSAQRVRGTARVTWFGADGRPVGTSEVRTKADRLATRSPADSLLSGTVVSGPLARERVSGSITPAMALLGCATRGMKSLAAAGRVTFG
ncbi:MAG: hypothetical protein HOY71_10520 [Nonomuraea sp.]|nr:hypothetical protein [Nonomuraea sp.]